MVDSDRLEIRYSFFIAADDVIVTSHL